MRKVSHRAVAMLISAMILAVGAVAITSAAVSDHLTVRTFSLEVPNQFPIVDVTPRRLVCEGPVHSPTRFDSVSIWGAARIPATVLRLTAQDSATGKILASARVSALPTESEQGARLSQPVAGGRSIRICVEATAGDFSLAGSPSVAHGVRMTGPSHRDQFSLLLEISHRTLLGSLALAFSRAALFRPLWVGVWTYWALLGGFVLAAVAAGTVVIRAASDPATEPPN